MEIELIEENSLTKSAYINFKYFVMSTSFVGRTANSDQALLIALINQHIQYTNGKSGIRPGVRKMRTETALNIKTVNSALRRLAAQGWIEQLSRGNREGTASIWRVKFSNPPVPFDITFDYKCLVNPLVETEVIWTKYGLGNRALAALNALHQEFGKSKNGLICTRIMESTKCSRPAVNKALEGLSNLNLVVRTGKLYSINTEIYECPEEFITAILDFYSVEFQKERRIKLHNLEKRLTADYRSRARQEKIQNLINVRSARKYSA